MNIPALPSAVVTSLAGTDRATAQHAAISSAPENNAHNVAASESVDSIDKGNASEDSGADGRQTLDTFERRQRDKDIPIAEQEEEKISVGPLADSTPHVGGRIDLTA